jgi:hypothetical protein
MRFGRSALVALFTGLLVPPPAVSQAAVVVSPPAARGTLRQVGVEVGEIAPGSGAGVVFVDAMKQASPWSAAGPLQLDRLGNVSSLAPGQVTESVVYAGDGAYPGGDYTLLFNGRADFAVVGGTIVSRAPGRWTVRVAPHSATGLRLRLLSTDPNDYARNIRLVLPGFERTFERAPFHPSFVHGVGGAQVLRLRGWMRAGTFARSAVWPLRPTTQRLTQDQPDGVAAEYLIALANASGANPWFTLPIGATDYYVYSFADLVRRTLDPRLHPAFEYGHETWRAGSATNGWARMAGANLHLSADPQTAALRFYSLRSTQVFAIVRRAFGPDANRVVRVLGVPNDPAEAQAVQTILRFANAGNLADAIALPASPATLDAGARLASAAGLRALFYGAGPGRAVIVAAGGAVAARVRPDPRYGFVPSPLDGDVFGTPQRRVVRPLPRLARPNAGPARPAMSPSLVGSQGTPLHVVDLTREGSVDWVHWGRGSSPDRKFTGNNEIGDFTVVGSARPQRFGRNFDTYVWSDEEPSGKQTRTATGVFVAGAGNGFTLTAPADTVTRTLRVYVGAYRAQGSFAASLSDGSAPPYQDTSLGIPRDATNGVYTLVYRAAKPGQHLTVTYTEGVAYASLAHVSLQSATLQSAAAHPPQSPPSDMTTFHVDNSRSGWDPNEYALTTANVASGHFVLLQTLLVDGNVLAQPLYVAQYAVPGKGTHNLLVVGTEHDTIYEFDADTGAIVNQSSLGTSQPSGHVGCGDISPEYGITSTPVIVRSTNTIYVVAATEPSLGTFVHTIHALDLGTLNDQVTPVPITASVLMSNGSTLTFDPQNQQSRTSLVWANGALYVGIGSHCDNNAGSIVGWMLKYDTNLNQVASFATAEDTTGYLLSSIWMTGYASAVDASGNIFAVTGNGAFDANTGGRNFGESVIKLDPALTGVQSYGTPKNWKSLNNGDVDFGSGGIILLPPQQANVQNLGVTIGKASRLWLVNQANLGGVGHPVQAISAGGGGVWGGPAYYSGPTGQFAYFQAGGDVLRAYAVKKGTAGNTFLQLSTSGTSGAGYGGSSPIVSSNGQNPGTGVVWLVNRNSTLTLEAYDATNVGNLLFSGSAGTWSNPQNNGFITPLVANGKVYVGATNTVSVFGMGP